MSVFGNYSAYYDLLYSDKDYAGEAEFVELLIKKYKPDAKSILELGCGSGGHAIELINKGFYIHGIDLSEEMLAVAATRRDQLPGELASKFTLAPGNVQSYRANKMFDCVISLFHVISYQPTVAELKAAFITAAEHLDAGGAFVFDVWYGPAVLTDKPVVRVKRMSNDSISVIRIAEPEWHANESLVDVHYTVFIRDRASNVIEELEEVHRMRYLFTSEIEMLAEAAGFTVSNYCEWMTGKSPGADTWGVCFILLKK